MEEDYESDNNKTTTKNAQYHTKLCVSGVFSFAQTRDGFFLGRCGRWSDVNVNEPTRKSQLNLL